MRVKWFATYGLNVQNIQHKFRRETRAFLNKSQFNRSGGASESFLFLPSPLSTFSSSFSHCKYCTSSLPPKLLNLCSELSGEKLLGFSIAPTWPENSDGLKCLFWEREPTLFLLSQVKFIKSKLVF